MRKFIASLENAEYVSLADMDRVLTDWDIPLDENITLFEASMWFSAQLHDNFKFTYTCVPEGMTSDEWDDAVEFICRCLRHGVVPFEHVNLLIKNQQAFDDWYNQDVNDS